MFDEILEELENLDIFNKLRKDPTLMMGSRAAPFLFARLLPSRIMESNDFAEAAMKLITIPAGDGNPLGIPPYDAGVVMSSISGSLGHIDGATQMSTPELEMLNKLYSNDRLGIDAVLRFVVSWLLESGRWRLEAKAELQRIEALVKGQVTVVTRNVARTYATATEAYRAVVPSGTVAAPEGLFNPDYNWMTGAIQPALDALRDKGFIPSMMISSNRNYQLLNRSNITQATTGMIIINPTTSQIEPNQNYAQTGAATAKLNGMGINEIISYDSTYPVQDPNPALNGKRVRKFFPPNYILIVGQTNETLQIINEVAEPSDSPILNYDNTLGYLGVGKSLGQTPGYNVKLRAIDNGKLQTWDLQTWAEIFPIITSGDAIAVLEIPDLV